MVTLLWLWQGKPLPGRLSFGESHPGRGAGFLPPLPRWKLRGLLDPERLLDRPDVLARDRLHLALAELRQSLVEALLRGRQLRLRGLGLLAGLGFLLGNLGRTCRREPRHLLVVLRLASGQHRIGSPLRAAVGL